MQKTIDDILSDIEVTALHARTGNMPVDKALEHIDELLTRACVIYSEEEGKDDCKLLWSTHARYNR